MCFDLRQALERQARSLRKTHEAELARERVRVADAVMARAEASFVAERAALLADFERQHNVLITEVAAGYQAQWAELQREAAQQEASALSRRSAQFQDEWRRRGCTMAQLREEHSKNPEATVRHSDLQTIFWHTIKFLSALTLRPFTTTRHLCRRCKPTGSLNVRCC